MQSNEIKALKVMQSSKTEKKKKESRIKELQNKLRQANKIVADKIKLKPDIVIVPEEQDIMLLWGRQNPSL